MGQNGETHFCMIVNHIRMTITKESNGQLWQHTIWRIDGPKTRHCGKLKRQKKKDILQLNPHSAMATCIHRRDQTKEKKNQCLHVVIHWLCKYRPVSIMANTIGKL